MSAQFEPGDVVEVSEDFPEYMRHFPKGGLAMVVGEFAYGGYRLRFFSDGRCVGTYPDRLLRFVRVKDRGEWAKLEAKQAARIAERAKLKQDDPCQEREMNGFCCSCGCKLGWNCYGEPVCIEEKCKLYAEAHIGGKYSRHSVSTPPMQKEGA